MKANPDRLTNAQARELLNGAAKKKPPIKWGAPVKLSESEQQTECVNWFRAKFPQYQKLLFAIPNGGHRSKRTAATLQREGVTPGVPDLLFCLPKNGFHGLFIEQKVKGNTTSPKQKEMLALLSEQGYKCEVVYSTAEFKTAIECYLSGIN